MSGTLEHRPVKLRRLCQGLALLVVAVFAVVALVLPASVQEQTPGVVPEQAQDIGVIDQASFFAIGLLLAGAILVLTRFRVRADANGIWVRNALGERYLPWGVVVALTLPEGATWARLELHDDELIGLLALQTSDGDLTIDVLIALRRLHQAATR